MAQSIFDTIVGQPVSGPEKASLLDNVAYGRDQLITDNPEAAGRYGMGESKLDWGMKYSDIPNLQEIRAAHQTPGEQFVGFLNQAVVGEIVGGTIEGTGYLLDLKSYGDLLNGTEKEFGNWFSDIGKKMRTWSEEATPIYVDPDQAKFAPGHWSWWMQNGKSVASTLSLMIPAAGAVRGISAIGKAMGMFSKVSSIAKWAAKGLTQAGISRHMEGMMEASGVQKEMYDKGIAKGMSPAEAEEYAAKAASKTYVLDWAMYLQDAPQYLLLNSAFGKGTGKLADKSIRAAAKMGKPLAPIIKSKSAAIGWDMVTEGFEEGYQFVAAEEAKYLADKFIDPSIESSFDTRLNKYLKDGELWTSAVMGAFGAGVMQTAGKAINDLIQGGDPETRFLKEFGSKISHAAQQVQVADLLGNESAKRATITNLETALFTKGASTGQMDNVKELIKRSGSPSEADLEMLGIDPASLETLQLNSEEILKHADAFEKRWDENIRKYDPQKAASVTQEEFLIDTFNEYKKDYNDRLSELKGNITNFNSLSLEAQDMFGISSQILANQKGIDFQKKRIADTKNPLSKKQKEGAQNIIDKTEKLNSRLKADLDTVSASREQETIDADNALNIGGPYNLLEAKSDKDITGHAILEHMKLSESLTFADQTLTAAQQRLKDILADKKKPEAKPKEPEDLARIPETDDYVKYTVDGKEHTGIVDYIDQDGDYVIVPTVKETAESKYATKPVGEPITVSKDKVVLDGKQYTEEDIIDESVSDEDLVDIAPIEEESVSYLDIAYMFNDGGERPTVTNEALHKFLIESKGDLEGITAEMFIDTTSDYAKEYFKSKGITEIELRRIANGKLTDNDLNTLFAKASVDTIPIGIQLIKDGKVLHKGGMYYHRADFKSNVVPLHISSQGEEVTRRYLADQRQSIRKARWNIIPNLLKGNEVYSDTLRISDGHYNNSTSRGNVVERHGLAINTAEMAISRKNGRVYVSSSNTVPGLSSKTAGTPFAPTNKTINGKKAWAKINPTKLTKEHAEILWDAILTRYSKGKGRMAAFPDNRVEGLNVGEVIMMLTLFGELKTNPNHENNKDMAKHLHSKAFFVNSGRNLTFGTTTVNIHEDDMRKEMENKENFIKWATSNKNYSLPLGVKPMGIELNSPLKRTFKLGSWENKADKDGNFLTTAQFLMSQPVDGKEQFAVVSDLQEYEGTGSAFVRPGLQLGDNMNAIKVRVRADNKPKVPKVTTKSKARSKTLTKVKGTPTIDSPIDLVNLPVGSEVYYMSNIVKEGVVTDEQEKVILAVVIQDKALGRALDLSRIQSDRVSKEFGQWLLLEHEGSFKSADKFVSYLKSLPHISKILVDASNTVEDKVQVAEPVPPVEVKTEPKPETNETVDSLEDLLGVPMLADIAGTVTSLVDLPNELKWFHKRFGLQNVKESDKLLTIASNGRKAFSVFTSDCIYVFTGAPEGALYHEAFHRVLLGYLTEEERQRIYASARKQYGELSDYDLSERMAEEFRAYKLNKTKPASRTIWQFFKDLYSFIVSYFTGQTRLTSNEIEKLYDSIDRGHYRYSKISADNLKRLENIQVPMSIEIRKTPISTISNYHELDKVVKFLTAILIQTNNIDNLNDVKGIKMSKMFDHVQGMMGRLQTMLDNTQKQLDDNLIPADKLANTNERMQISRNLLGVLQTVTSDSYRDLFVDKIADMLTKLNVKRIQDEDGELDDKVNNNYKEKYDSASYEINSKDNILASVKFLIATLPKNGQLDPHIGISEFVDFNDMWNSLMHRLYDINDDVEMMDRLKSFTDDYPYQALVKKLEEDITGVRKQQLRAAVQKHRHNFVNFLLTLGKEGVKKIEILNADVSSASKLSIKEWNLLFYGSKALQITSDGVIINNKVVDEIYNDYSTFSKKVEKEYASTKTFANRKDIIDNLVALLKRVGIEVDALSVEELVSRRVAENKDDALFQVISSDFSYTFAKVKNVTKETATKIFSDEKYVRTLAEAYVQTHPEKISDVILGPSNNVYYVYSQNSYVTDTVRKIRTDRSFLEEHLKKVYNDNSYYGQQMMADDNVRKGIEVLTFAMFGDKGSSGLDYLNINPIEDYIFKLTAMANGMITFPTMADKKTYYLLKGLKPFDFKYTANNDGTFSMPAETLDILLGYAKSERNRIVEAKRVIDEYLAAKESGNEERIKELEKGLVEGYHYKIKGKEKFFGKDNSAALRYHNFPSFNRDGFNFDLEAREEIRQSTIANIREELEYIESLGIVASVLDVNTGKKRYYNRLLDQSLVSEGIKNYGTMDLAIKNIVASFFINTVIANNEVEKLFSGDPAFFKTDKDTKRVIEDKIKRLGVLTSTGDNFATSVPEQGIDNESFNIVTIATQKYQSIYYDEMQAWHLGIQKKRIAAENPDMAEAEVESIAKALVADTLKAYREMDPTDGQAWISPAMYKSLSQRLGEWSPEKNVAFDLLQQDRKLTLEEEKLVLNVTFQPLKLVYFSLLHDGKLAIPTFHKASFATIFRTMTKGTYGNRQIVDMLDRMEGKGKYDNPRLEKVDMFMMDSATKVGNRAKINMLDENLELFADLSKAEVYKQPINGLRRQLVTDAHDVARTKTGTQFLKIILGNLFLDEEVYTIDGKQVNGRYIRDTAFHALNSLSNRGKAEIEKRLGFKDGHVDKAKLVELLTEDAKKSNASDNLVDAITMMGDDMYLEIDSLTDRKWIQSRIISLISKATVDVNLPGNQLIQFSNLGIRSINPKYTLEEEMKAADKHVHWVKNATDDLKWMKLENGKTVPMGAIVSINLFKHIIPHYDEISYEEKISFLTTHPEILGYRIPTQGPNSVFMLSIVGIYPETIGDTITLPTEFVALTGSDFDIDKVYAVRYNYVVIKGKLEKVKFIEGNTDDENVLKQIYRFRYGRLLNIWDHLVRKITPSTDLSADDITNLNQMFEITDDQEIEEIIKKIIKLNRYDGTLFNRINEKLKGINVDDFVKNNKGKDIYDINSRKAVENRLLDAFFAVMKSEAHFTFTSAPLGPLTDRLKKKAQKIRAAQDTEKIDMYYQSPRFNESVKFTYNGGKGGIGPFALNNVHHVLAQLAGLEMKGSFGDVMYRGTDGRNIDLSKSRGKDGLLILDWLSALIDAHVDVAKDPYIMDINVNEVTYNVVALLLRGGAGEVTFDFLAQPILRELANETMLTDENNNVLTKKLTIEDGTDEEGQPKYKVVDAETYISKKWSSTLTEQDIVDINKQSTTDAFSNKLASDMLESDMTNKEFVKRQMLVLKAFKELQEMSKKLNTLVQASQIDTKKFGSNITELRVFMNKIRRAYDDDAFINLEKILPYDPDSGKALDVEGANFLGTYAANAIKFSLDVLSDISIYGTPVFEELFNKIVKVSGNEFTTDSKFVNIVSDEIFSAVVSKFFTSPEYAGIDHTKLKVLIDATAQKLASIKRNDNGVYDDLKDNMFLNYLYLAPTDDEILPFNMFVTVPMKSTKDKTDKDNMINSFKELLQHDRVEVRNLGRQLFYYSYFASGFRGRIYSYFTLLPNELFKEISIKNPSNPESMVDRSYNEMIKNILADMKNIMSVLSYNNIVDEVLINNHDNDNLIKFVNDRGIAHVIPTYKDRKSKYEVGVVLTPDMSKYLFLGYNDSNQPVYRPYIKIHNQELGHLIMKYIGYITIQNGDKAELKPVYATQNMRSYNKRGVVVKEFNMLESIISAYNELQVLKTNEDEIDFLNTISQDGVLYEKGVNFVHLAKDDQLILTDKIDTDETEKETQEEGRQGVLNFEEDEFPFTTDERDKFSTEPKAVSDLVTEMGIVDWSVVTADQWRELKNAYKHCN